MSRNGVISPNMGNLILFVQDLRRSITSFKSMQSGWTGVAQGVGHHPANPKVTGLIPRQGTCLGYKQAWSLDGGVREATDRCFSHTWMFLSLSFSLLSPLSLKIN